MTPVIYPPTIITDFERLCAVYPLIEQMRLEHNRVAELARSDPDKYLKTGKFRTYAKESKSRLKKLLAERNRLVENIRSDNRAIWEGVTDEEALTAIHLDLFGDRETLKNKETEATSPLLDELKALNLDTMPEGLGDDPTEDLTTYTEVDPDSHISKTTDRATFTDLTGDESAYLYYDKGVGHFDGDFEHLLKCLCDEYATPSGGIWVNFWVVANYVGSMDANNNQLLTFFYSSGGGVVIYLREYYSSTGYSDYTYISTDVTYYIELERDEGVGSYGTLYEYICTGDYYDDGGSLVDALSVTLHGKEDFRYIYALQSRTGNPDRVGDGWMELLDLQEAGVTEKTGSDTGSGAESSEETAALSKSEAGSGVEDILGRDLVLGETGTGADSLLALLAAVIAFETGSGVEQSLLSYLLSSSDSGSSVEEAALIAVLVLGDVGTGADVSILPWLKAVFGSDEGSGFDALKVLVGTTGSSSGMRLHGRTGQVRTPSKGVNL